MVYDDPSRQSWALSFIHCPADNCLKEDFWTNLSQVGERFGGPLVILGDYNIVLDQSEKQRGRLVGSSSTNGMYQMVLTHGLVDSGYVGSSFTWCNGSRGSRCIKERLDKGFANTAWSTLFPCALVYHLPRTSSNHCPILLSS